MAIIITMFCHTCKTNQRVAVGSGQCVPTICPTCAAKDAEQEWREWSAGREGLTLEERIRGLERFTYEHTRQRHYTGETRF